VDGQISVIGGRNIGDEYFGTHEEANFADLDLAVIGPAVQQVSREFDLYWNHAASIPIGNLAKQKTTPDQMAEQRTALIEHRAAAAQSAYAGSVRNSEFARQLRSRNISFSWGRATVVNDQPDKVLTSSAKTETHLAPQLREVVDHTRHELFLISPYFVPGKNGVALLAGVRER